MRRFDSDQEATVSPGRPSRSRPGDTADRAAGRTTDRTVERTTDRTVERAAGRTVDLGGPVAARLLALQRAAGNRAVADGLRRRTPGPDQTVQRLIGFEFETPWMLKGPGGTLGSDTSVVEGMAPPRSDLSGSGQKETAQERSARRQWHMSPDMRPPPRKEGTDELPDEFKPQQREVPLYPALGKLSPTRTETVAPKYSGFGNLEFITKAVDEDEAGRNEIHQIVREIQEVVTWIGRTGPADAVPVHQILSTMKSVEFGPHLRDNAKRLDVVVDRTSCDVGAMWASMQMSAGIKLEQIPTLMEQLAAKPVGRTALVSRFPDDSKNAAQRQSFTDALAVARRALGTDQIFEYLPPRKQQAVTGALATVAHIVTRARTASGDPDRPADFRPKYLSAMLSRTNLGAYRDLIKETITATSFRDHVLAATGRDSGEPLFAALDRRYHRALTEWKIGDWIDQVAVNGRDPINWGQDVDDPRWKPQQVGPAGDRGVGHVFELRALPNVAHRDWAAYASYFHRYAALINTVGKPAAKDPSADLITL